MSWRRESRSDSAALGRSRQTPVAARHDSKPVQPSTAPTRQSATAGARNPAPTSGGRATSANASTTSRTSSAAGKHSALGGTSGGSASAVVGRAGAPKKEETVKSAAFTVTTQSKKDEVGIQTLLGDYEDKGTNHGRRYFQKVQKIVGHEDIKVFLYFWDERDGKDFSGWWFGDALGGSQVWARAASNSATPPRTGWRIPWDAQKAELGALLVDPFASSHATSGGRPPPNLPPPARASGGGAGAAESQDRIVDATAKVAEIEQSAQDALDAAKAAMDSETTREVVRELKDALETQQAALLEAQKRLTAQLSEVRKLGPSGTHIATELSKLSPRLMKLRSPILIELGRLSKLSTTATSAAAKEAKAAQAKHAQERDSKELQESLPACVEVVAAAEDAAESLNILAAPLVAEPPDEEGELLNESIAEIEIAAREAASKLNEARKNINLKLQDARQYSSDVRKEALKEFTALQQRLTDAQRKLNPFKNFRKEFKERVEVKKALREVADKLSGAELEAEKVAGMATAASHGQMSDDEIAAAEKVAAAAQKGVSETFKMVDAKLKGAGVVAGPMQDELLSLKEKASSVRKKLDAANAVLKQQREGLAIQQTMQLAREKVERAESSLQLTGDAEAPFLKGIEVLPPEESKDAIADCVMATSKVHTAVQSALSFLKQKAQECRKYTKELQKTMSEEIGALQKRSEEVRKKLDAFKKETSLRKTASMLSEVSDSVATAEDRVKGLTAAAAIFSNDDLEEVSVETLQEASEASNAAETQASAACTKARKTLALKQREAKDDSDASAMLRKLQARLNAAQQDMARARKAAGNGTKIKKDKEVLQQEQAKVTEAEAEVDKLERLANPVESGLGDEKISDDALEKIDEGAKAVQKLLKGSQRAVEACLPGTVSGLKTALQKLNDRCAKALKLAAKVVAKTKGQRERMLGERYMKEATAKVVELETAMEKVAEAELPFLKGLEVLPLQETNDTIAASENSAVEAQACVSSARTCIASKGLEIKQFGEAAAKDTKEGMDTLTERVNKCQCKLAQLKKDTDIRRRVAQMREATEKVNIADAAIKTLGDAVQPFTGEGQPDMEVHSDAAACEKLAASSQEAQSALDIAKKAIQERQKDVKDAKDASSKDKLKDLQDRLIVLSQALGRAKKIASTHEQKYVAKRVLVDGEALVASAEDAFKAATEVCSPLLTLGGEEFLVAASCDMLTSVLREHAKEKDLTLEALFEQIGGTSEDAFKEWLTKLPEALDRQEVNFSEKRRLAIFRHLDSTKGGLLTLENWKDMFKRRFMCVTGISATEAFEVAKSKTVCKVERGEVLEAIGDPQVDEGRGMTRVECRIESTGAKGFVTIEGNEGTTYLEAYTPFTAFVTKMDKTISESVKAVSKALSFLGGKSKELASHGGTGPLREASGELKKMLPKVNAVQSDLESLKKQVAAAKTEYAKREQAERTAHIEAKDRKDGEAILGVATSKLELVEAAAKKVGEVTSPLTSLHGQELEEFGTPATTLAQARSLIPAVAESATEAREVLNAQLDKIGKDAKGPLLETQKELRKLTAKVEATLRAAKSKVMSAERACRTISDSKAAVVASALRADLLTRGIKLEDFFVQHADSEDKISEEAFCKLVTSLEGHTFQLEHLQLVARSIETGGLGKTKFLSFLQKYFVVVTSIAITNVFEISNAKTIRKAELDEVIEVLEGPRVDEKLKMTRVRGKSLVDGAEGWISVKGNQGTPFLQEVEKPYYACATEVTLEQDFEGLEPPVRVLKADEVLELIEGPRKQTVSPSLRVRGTASSDQAAGWFTARDNKGNILAKADDKCYKCTTTVAMTDELDIKSCKVLRKLSAGEVLTVLEGPVQEEKAGITRLKVKAAKDDQVGWVTAKGNAGTVYAEPDKKRYTILQEQPLQKTFKTVGKPPVVRKLQRNETVELMEGPKEEQHQPETRLKVRALSGGEFGWITLQSSNVKAWTPNYKVLKAGAIHGAKVVEGVEVLRETVAGERLRLLEGPELLTSGALRMKARAEKDGVVGWVTVKDAEGKRFCEWTS